jgi:hypothetical protein
VGKTNPWAQGVSGLSLCTTTKMHQVWKTMRPDLSNITQQRLDDQKRVIHRNNLLTAIEINHIKDEISKEIIK